MNRLLSDIDISRSALIATFLELEAAVRSCMCSSFPSFFFLLVEKICNRKLNLICLSSHFILYCCLKTLHVFAYLLICFFTL